jgi:hypothetical protein
MTVVLHESYVHWCYCLSSVFLEWDIFQTKVVENVLPRVLCSYFFFFRESIRVGDNVKKYGRD